MKKVSRYVVLGIERMAMLLIGDRKRIDEKKRRNLTNFSLYRLDLRHREGILKAVSFRKLELRRWRLKAGEKRFESSP